MSNITEISSLQPHQQRVVRERDALQTQATALQQFINGEVFTSLDSAEQARLVKQNGLQYELLAVLNERIAYFTTRA